MVMILWKNKHSMMFEGEYGFLQLDKVCAVKITG